MAIDHIRLSEQARDQLVRVKRWTGVKNWNVLCRWAFCISLAEPTPPQNLKIPADSNVEMTWKVFGGQHADVYWALLVERAERDGISISDDALGTLFRQHLHRGIAYFASDRSIRSIRHLVERSRRPPRDGSVDLIETPFGEKGGDRLEV